MYQLGQNVEDYTRIKRRRNELGLTQKQLADAAGVNTRTITRLEKRQEMPSFATVALLSGALFPGEPERFKELVTIPDFSKEIELLNTDDEIPADFKPALRRLLDVDDPDGISVCLAYAGASLPRLVLETDSLGVIIWTTLLPFFYGLIQSTDISCGPDVAVRWKAIRSALTCMGEDEWCEKMDAAWASQELDEKLLAVKNAVSIAWIAYEPGWSEPRLTVLRNASAILGKAVISERADRRMMFHGIMDYSKVLNKYCR